jgi:hypothetical protein
MQTLVIHYTVGLVIVSVLLSIGASFAALSLSDRVRAATTVGPRRFWLTSGSVAMGGRVCHCSRGRVDPLGGAWYCNFGQVEISRFTEGSQRIDAGTERFTGKPGGASRSECHAQ